MVTRMQISGSPKAVPLVDIRTIGKAPTFIGENKDWPEWSFQFTAYMGSANPKSVEALRWAAMAENPIAAAAVRTQALEANNRRTLPWHCGAKEAPCANTACLTACHWTTIHHDGQHTDIHAYTRRSQHVGRFPDRTQDDRLAEINPYQCDRSLPQEASSCSAVHVLVAYTGWAPTHHQ